MSGRRSAARMTPVRLKTTQRKPNMKKRLFIARFSSDGRMGSSDAKVLSGTAIIAVTGIAGEQSPAMFHQPKRMEMNNERLHPFMNTRFLRIFLLAIVVAASPALAQSTNTSTNRFRGPQGPQFKSAEVMAD